MHPHQPDHQVAAPVDVIGHGACRTMGVGTEPLGDNVGFCKVGGFRAGRMRGKQQRQRGCAAHRKFQHVRYFRFDLFS